MQFLILIALSIIVITINLVSINGEIYNPDQIPLEYTICADNLKPLIPPLLLDDSTQDGLVMACVYGYVSYNIDLSDESIPISERIDIVEEANFCLYQSSCYEKLLDETYNQNNRNSLTNSQENQSPIEEQQPTNPSPTNLEAENFLIQLIDPVTVNVSALGNKDAKISMVEFGDYQCEDCAKFHTDTLDKIITNFIDTDDVRFLYKDLVLFDLPEDKASSLAAEASYCAADQGKYWDYHNEVYKNWNGENTGWVNKDSLRQFANNINITDLMVFSDCLDSHKHSEIVKNNTELARTLGISSTPTFVLFNGTALLPIPGAHPYEVFENVIFQMKG